jgi:formate dehydrogenase subunit delta
LAAELADPDGLAEAHQMPPARIAQLANDIAAQFPHQSDAQAAATIAAHIKMFWEPRMITELTALSSRNSSDLVELARAAAQLLAGQP